MENNDSPLKPQPTGGLKLMTVFIAVLALHVVVIGGFTVYHLMSGSTTDADLLTDKAHKAPKDVTLASDGQMPDSTTTSTATTTAPSDGSSPVANPSATASTAPATTAPTSTTEPATTATAGTQAPNPLQSELAISPPDIAPVPPTSAEIASGPVKMPPAQSKLQPEPEPPVSTPAPVVTTPEPSAGTPYVVKAHDSLAKIARHNHTTVAELKSANNLSSDFLKINQKLVIPAAATTSVASTSTTTAPEALAATTVLTDSAPTASTPAPKTSKSAKASKMVATTATPAALHHHTYTVVKGDTLTRIAHKFKTTPTAIMTANSITDPAKLSIGKKLKIPSMESRSAKNTPAPVTPPAQVQASAPTAQLANFVQ